MIEILDARDNPDKSAYDINLVGHNAVHTNVEIAQLAIIHGLTPELIAGQRFSVNDDDLLQSTHQQIIANNQDKPEILIAYDRRTPVGFIHTECETVQEAGADLETVRIISLFAQTARKRVATQLGIKALGPYVQELPLQFTVAWWNIPMRRWGETIGFQPGPGTKKPLDITYVAESISLARQNMREI